MEEGAIDAVLLIGGSAGCLDVLLQLIGALPVGFRMPVVIVVHRKSESDGLLTDLLSARSNLPVQEIEEKDRIQLGNVYLVPGNYHVLFEQDGTFSLDDSEKVNYSRPSIDVVFQSAAHRFGAAVTAILLSGANADGTDGCASIVQKKGITIAQAPATAEVAFMVEHAIRRNVIRYVMDVGEMIAYLTTSSK